MRWALFISGQGSNMSALIDQRSNCDAVISLVVSSSPKSYGLLRAQRNGIPTLVLESKIQWDTVLTELNSRGITHIFLVGFMKIVPPDFLEKWSKPILNVHPSLLPDYPGLQSIRRAYNDKKSVGVTVHRVTADVDAGSIVMNRVVCDAQRVAPLSLPEVEEQVHLAEYDLVRKSFKVASCWT